MGVAKTVPYTRGRFHGGVLHLGGSSGISGCSLCLLCWLLSSSDNSLVDPRRPSPALLFLSPYSFYMSSSTPMISVFTHILSCYVSRPSCSSRFCISSNKRNILNEMFLDTPDSPQEKNTVLVFSKTGGEAWISSLPSIDLTPKSFSTPILWPYPLRSPWKGLSFLTQRAGHKSRNTVEQLSLLTCPCIAHLTLKTIWRPERYYLNSIDKKTEVPRDYPKLTKITQLIRYKINFGTQVC